MTTDSTAAWTAAFRSAVVSPYETIDLFELRGFAGHTLRQIIRLDGGGTALRIRLSNRYGKKPLHITGADVLAPADTRIAVAFGDSWFEGTGTTHDTDHRFPDLLNQRLRDAGSNGWVVNQGISANRLLTDEIGEHALARLERDALTVPGVTHVLIHFGLNDLGIPGQEAYPEPAPIPTAADLIAGFTALADRIHAAGLTATATTIGPYKDTIYDGYSTPEGLAVAREVNDWIRGADSPFDSYADFAAAVADPADPDRIHDDHDSGDGLHVNDAGAKALADSVDLATLTI
ncbi:MULTISPECIES: GDSL-type esterase/lipase family protein [unclassified Streptomyces]|uniref:GDSL-type esterase/lipase family protein n=1 Tax=unclassified Streptomyces TaxID=2593676 RepID=UPI00136FB505|nr:MULTISPECIES: GDSL-type esterase/lipase family protein [unclassified Streptomyces]NDZ99259.1 hypothetical protein [Streptomyces sp. SID10116]MYY81707.1 hypothetical protein [Streptomyces sp. SID335]MYZ12914.1 hypothetical protein [Streptomyces sp. SID337]NDZ91598.1 hypothetical protein [Streptomyces sp. SID10115]NEA06427.1 hypothetical protein [Streptomyces sp. SID10116]